MFARSAVESVVGPRSSTSRVVIRLKVTEAAPAFETTTLGAAVRPRRRRAGALLPGTAETWAAEITRNPSGTAFTPITGFPP